MDWNAAIERNREALKRIVALLFAFAALADCAGTRPRPIRIVVLWLLRAVESIAWDFVIAVAEESGVYPDFAVLPNAHDPDAYDIADDAGRLARSFTALANLLADLMRRSPPPLAHGRTSGPADHLMQVLCNLASSPRALERPQPDTS